MAFQVIWTVNASADFENVISYLLRRWGNKTAVDFIETTDSRVNRISIFPEIGIVSVKDPSIRSIVITKHNKLYYRITGNSIEILSIFDTRQNPEKNQFD